MPESGREVEHLLRSARWDLVFWHITGPFLEGLHGLDNLRKKQPDTHVVVVASEADKTLAQRALRAGADCYLLTDNKVTLTQGVEATVRQVAGSFATLSVGRTSTTTRAEIIANLTQDAVFVASPAGIVIRANRRAQELTGRPLARLLGTPLARLFHPREAVEGALAAATTGPTDEDALSEHGDVGRARHPGPLFDGEAFLVQEGGSFILVRLVLGAVEGGPEDLEEIIAVATPQTSPLGLSEEMQQAQALADVVARTISEAIALVDGSGVVVMANPAMARLLGLTEPLDCVGLRVDRLARGTELQEALTKTLREGRPTAIHAVIPAHGPSPTPLRGRIVPVADDQILSGRALLVLEPPGAELRRELMLPRAPAIREAVETAVREAAGELQAALQSLVQAAAEALPGAAVGLIALGSGQPVAVWHGFSASLGQALASLVLSRLQARECAAGMSLVLVPDLTCGALRDQDAEWVAALAAEGWKCAALVPLTFAGELLGLLVVASDRPQPPTLSEELLEQFDWYFSMALALLAPRQAVEGERRWLERLASFGNELGLVPGVQQLVASSVTDVVRIFEADWGAIYLVEPGGGRLELAARTQGDDVKDSGGTLSAQSVQVATEALRRDRAVVRIVTTDGRAATVAGVRLADNGDASGALVVGWNVPTVLDELALRTLELVARRVGVALRHARVREEEASRASQMRAAAEEAMEVEARVRSLLWAASAAAELTDLNRVLWTLIDASLRAVNVEEIRIYLADYEAGALRGAIVGRSPDIIEPLDHIVPLQRSASARADAALSEAAYLISAVEENGKDYEAALIPLRTRAALVGLLEAGNPQSGRPVLSRDLRLLRMLAGLAAVAIDRARMDAMREAMERSVSHELRTPLSSIRAYTELLLDEGAGPVNEEQRLFLQRVAMACDYLQTLVEDLLDLSRLRAGEMQVRNELIDLEAVLGEVVERLSQRIEETGATVTVSVAPEVCNIVTDPTRLCQIVTNLVDNAIKFSPPSSQVVVRAILDGSDVAIAVADNGPGIPESEREAIFREFYRGKSGAVQSRPGAGLGLAIARRVARLLGGELTVESEVGAGSTFWLRFPYRYPDLTGEKYGGGTEREEEEGAERPEHPHRRRRPSAG
ncbi:MAG: ATP-binding protein [Armatimonadetes bacterium]|nr:ATP-binding protein [Armatimonadota bacterium]